MSKASIEMLRSYTLTKYIDVYARRKVINFAKAFLCYLSKTRFDPRYKSFDLFLALPKGLKERKHIATRIVTKADIENVLRAIERAHVDEELSSQLYHNYRATVLFGAFTGQRPLATIAKLAVGQFREALKTSKPVLDIPPDCDKIKMQHYCPLHPQVVDAMLPVLDGQSDDELVFEQLSFQLWLRHNEIWLTHGGARIVNGDLRKFAEQHGDIIGWDQSNRAYILTHGVSGVDWTHYKHPLPEHVYDMYMRYWGHVTLK
ncbi:MAG: hypothetical protein WCB79_09605 [Halobacteriota archaeon]